MQQAGRFLADVGSLLASSLDYEETLAGVARFAVRSLADFCIIDIVEDGEVKRLKVAHADAAQAELTEELQRFALDRRRPHLSWTALETGTAVLVPEVSDAFLESKSQGAEHRRILEALQPRSLMAEPLLGRDRILGVVLFVSSSRSYDADDLALAEALVRLVGLEVDNARLYRESQRALQARDRVLGIVAHDLRNPLDVACIEADRLSLHREIQGPRDLAEEAVELSVSLAAAKSLSLRCESDQGLPEISADRDRILQVLSNLIGNAIKFTPEGGSIEVRVERVEEGARFTVIDTGPGIPQESLPNLFQPFWQAERGSLDGAGLGLMIARGIVAAHGGTIGVESAPEKGSRFHFTLPAVSPPPEGERRHGPADRRVPIGKIVAPPVHGTPGHGPHAAR